MNWFEKEVEEIRDWFGSRRFEGVRRLHSARDVAAQQGTLRHGYTVAREAAERFHARLRELFDRGEAMTTFGPYSPGQAVAMKRQGIDGIYLGGWATSAKGGITEDPGPDLASYPLNQVPDEAAVIVRALLTADRNQHFLRSRMSEEERRAVPAVDYSPWIIADADTGHGGDAHVRNLIRRFVEVGVPGYHIEDQRAGTKKCGHQGGKVLVSSEEQIRRLNTARFQLDVMRVPGLIVARTDAESAKFLDSRLDERDQPFILGATNTQVPSYRAGTLAILRTLSGLGVDEAGGYMVSGLSESEYRHALQWLDRVGLTSMIEEAAAGLSGGQAGGSVDTHLERINTRFTEIWRDESGLTTYGEAVARVIGARAGPAESLDMTAEEWRAFSARASLYEARERARSMGVDITWDPELPRTPDGFYQIRGGIDYAIVKSLAAAPFADIVWMETKTANLGDARRFAEAIRAEYPDQMMAYNLSPSFNWDTTGMSDAEMRRFPEELGRMGFVFNFITYGGHQIDGLAAEEFSAALNQEGMLALARLQRRLRLLESPYRTPQTLVGGPRLDAALTGSSGRTASTKAMGEGSTQVQHLVQTEVPPGLLEGWLGVWQEHNGVAGKLRVHLGPHRAGSEELEVKVVDEGGGELANLVFMDLRDRRGRAILSVRDGSTAEHLRRKRLMTVVQCFLFHRYGAESVHYLTPTEDIGAQARRMSDLGIFTDLNAESRRIIVADVDRDRIRELAKTTGASLIHLIRKESPQAMAV